jgi:hypothetical protein
MVAWEALLTVLLHFMWDKIDKLWKLIQIIISVKQTPTILHNLFIIINSLSSENNHKSGCKLLLNG